jgi:hypothetical protein
MPDLLRRSPLTAQDVPLFAAFNCGTQHPWEQDVNDWIHDKSPDGKGISYDLRKKRCRVFKYRNSADQWVGFAALSESNFEWPARGAPRVKVAIIPWLGVDQRFHRLPADPPRYSDQIVADMILEARATGLKMLALFVDPNNTAAIKVYARNGFASSPVVPLPGEYLRMAIYLPPLIPNGTSG